MTTEEQEVLVVDNDILARMMVGRILESSYKIVEASSGKEAVDMVNKNIKFITMDNGMEELDSGIKAVKEIRQLHPNMPIICISGTLDSMKKELSDFKKIWFFKKPIQKNELEDVIKIIKGKRNIKDISNSPVSPTCDVVSKKHCLNKA